MWLKIAAMRLLPRSLRHRTIRSMLRLDEAVLSSVIVRVADTKEEVIAAARLLHDSYVGRGLMPPHPSGVRIVAHQALPETITIVAKIDEQVVGTLSLVLDAAMGLPMETIYAGEVQALRDAGRRVAEVGALCIHRDYRHTGIAFLLNKLMWKTAQDALGVQDLLIAVHPYASELYEAALHFEHIGPVRRYPGLSEAALAVALRLDLVQAEANYRRAWGRLPKTPSNPFYLYCERHDPQLHAPVDARFVKKSWPKRILAIAELFALRPESLKGVPKEQFDVLRAMITARYEWQAVSERPDKLAAWMAALDGDISELHSEPSAPVQKATWLSTVEWAWANQ